MAANQGQRLPMTNFNLKISVGVDQTARKLGKLWVLNWKKESPDG
jgi:hypothetical protein